ncbi:DgyrCDS140 [Dimorphilus gyrociliatus]|uniref:DgyrCDS140 n=1 Tax=Dimorphilus gyrociliatus TaxID=2664684 RepID=A0A7I8V6G3_9ANNE|nr:DgyrCDS140 [Dimorphilus gyrociliatus]
MIVVNNPDIDFHQRRIRRNTLPDIKLDYNLWYKSRIDNNNDDDNDKVEEYEKLPPIFKEIIDEKWFAGTKHQAPESIIKNMIDIMHICNDSSYENICDYIVKIHENYGYPSGLQQFILADLAEQLNVCYFH